jgi:tetratricopeptide (TPR) repeat protein
MGKYNEALPWAEKAYAAFPNVGLVIDTLATVYQGLGRYNEALELFEQCLKIKKEENEPAQKTHDTEKKIEKLKELINSQSVK